MDHHLQPRQTSIIIVSLCLLSLSYLASTMSTITMSNNNIDNHNTTADSSNRERRFLFLPSSSSSSHRYNNHHNKLNDNNDNQQNIIDETKLPLLYIGEVDLTNHLYCHNWLQPILYDCQLKYENYLRLQINARYEYYRLNHNKFINDHHHYRDNNNRNHHLSDNNQYYYDYNVNKFRINRNDEYIKHASCCGMWHARNCVINHIRQQLFNDINNHQQHRIPDDCPNNLIELYQNLPNEPSIKETVFDYCSEYSDGSLICNQLSSSSFVAFKSLSLIFILPFLSSFFIIYKLINFFTMF